MKKTGIIYKAANKINGKSYIGQTIKILSKRISMHYSRAKYANNHFHYALRKYKKTDWEWKIICDNISSNQLNNMEIHKIIEYDTFYNGYNSTEGVEVNPMNYPEIRIKISKALKGRKFSEESKRKMSEAQKGEKHCNFGKCLSEETRKKISESNKGKILSEETKRKISISNTGKKHTNEVRKKMSEDRSGEKNAHHGKPHSKETKKKLSQMFSKTWKIIYPTSKIVIIKGLSQFCKDNGLSRTSMGRVARGKLKNHKGFGCEYYYGK